MNSSFYFTLSIFLFFLLFPICLLFFHSSPSCFLPPPPSFMKVAKREHEVARILSARLCNTFRQLPNAGESRLAGSQKRFQSSYLSSRRVRDADGMGESAYRRDAYHRGDPEAVIRAFESQPALHNSPAAIAEYVKALVKLNRLDESELLRTLQRGLF